MLADPLAAGAPVSYAVLVLVAAVAWWSSRRARRTDQPVAAAVVPYLSVLTAAFMPLAVALYLLVTTTWTAVENATIRRNIGVFRTPDGRG